MKSKSIIFCLMLSLVFLLTSCNNSNYDINDLYEITDNGNFTYNYTIKDKNGKVLLSDKNSHREPQIDVINDHLLKISLQTGTGISTHWTIYCNVDSGNISETYHSVLGEYEDKVIFIDFEKPEYKVVVRDIFDKNIFYKETVLSGDFVGPDPVVDFKITEKGIATITYLKGKDFIETEITIDLKENDISTS